MYLPTVNYNHYLALLSSLKVADWVPLFTMADDVMYLSTFGLIVNICCECGLEPEHPTEMLMSKNMISVTRIYSSWIALFLYNIWLAGSCVCCFGIPVNCCDRISLMTQGVLVWISNYLHYNIWDEITYSFLNFNGATVNLSHTLLLDMWLLIHKIMLVKEPPWGTIVTNSSCLYWVVIRLVQITVSRICPWWITSRAWD